MLLDQMAIINQCLLNIAAQAKHFILAFKKINKSNYVKKVFGFLEALVYYGLVLFRVQGFGALLSKVNT